MSLYFNADEIFKMAEQIERNGAKFYRHAAEKIANVKISERLLQLAAMEDKHEEVFAFMRKDASKNINNEPVFDTEDQSTQYLRAWADGHVFKVREDTIEGLTGEETMKDVLGKAIDLEKDSIIFYLGMKDALVKERDKESIDKIIQEEMSHIASLSTELANMKHRVN